MVDTMETLTSALALVVAAGAAVLVVARLSARRSDRLAAVGRRIDASRTALTAVIAGGSTLGSLYFSEVANYIPCRLCWFQRIAMYPIALIAIVALVRRRTDAGGYIVPMAAIGAAISAYHYLLEWKPSLEGGACGLSGPACADIWFREFGFVTLAFMALCGFVSIIILHTVSFDSVARQEAS